jgi:predicted DNA-binding transcriptional regulator YafY
VGEPARILRAGKRVALDVLALEDIQEAADGSISATVLVHDPQWLVHIMLSLGGIAEVTTPETLRLAVADAAERALTAYAEDA